jgi:hypothetical protein
MESEGGAVHDGSPRFHERFLAACGPVLFVVEPRISAVLARVD